MRKQKTKETSKKKAILLIIEKLNAILRTRVELTLKIGKKEVKKKTAIAIDELSRFIAKLADFVDGLLLY